MARGDLTEEQWAQLEPLLPSSKGKRGGQWGDHRQVINGIRWVLRTAHNQMRGCEPATLESLPPQSPSAAWHKCGTGSQATNGRPA